MPEANSKATIVSMAVIASAAATLLHEGLGHGLTAWLRGDTVVELTSNHLSSLTPDHWVQAGGTIVNLIAGFGAFAAMQFAGSRCNLRYFLWLLAALNLLPAAGYFMLSGIFGFGDWYEVIKDLPNQLVVRGAMSLIGVTAYVGVVRLLAVGVRPFAPDGKSYNTVGRLPYYAAGIFSGIAGAFDPLGIKLLLISTLPAAFGGSSGLLWADSLMPKSSKEPAQIVRKQSAWWVAAILLGGAYVWFLGRGIEFQH
jgi:hypothetical protein